MFKKINIFYNYLQLIPCIQILSAVWSSIKDSLAEFISDSCIIYSLLTLLNEK